MNDVVLNKVQIVQRCVHRAREERASAGVPNTSADAFRLLVQIGILEEALGERLARMVGFRNVAVHAYRALDLDILERVLQEGLDDLLECCELLRRAGS